MEYLWLVVAWGVYFILHSILAIRQLKHYAHSKGISPQKYRLFYNIFSLISLVPVLIISNNISAVYAISPNSILKLVGLILAGYGVVLAKLAFKPYDTKAFLGLAPHKQESFKTEGLLKYVRHPIYSASIVILIGYFLFDPRWNTLLNVIMLIIYFVVGGYFEERKLIREFGEQYIEYKKKTPMLIPRFWRRG